MGCGVVIVMTGRQLAYDEPAVQPILTIDIAKSVNCIPLSLIYCDNIYSVGM